MRMQLNPGRRRLAFRLAVMIWLGAWCGHLAASLRAGLFDRDGRGVTGAAEILASDQQPQPWRHGRQGRVEFVEWDLTGPRPEGKFKIDERLPGWSMHRGIGLSSSYQ